MIRFKEDQVGEILRRLYDSEINIEISSFWDGGYDFRIGDTANGFKQIGPRNIERTSANSVAEYIYGSTGVVCDMITHLAFHAAEFYPESDFAIWYKKQRDWQNVLDTTRKGMEQHLLEIANSAKIHTDLPDILIEQ